MYYYELYGLPGAGKTTIALQVINCLKSQGYKVASYDDVFGSGIIDKKYWLKILFNFKMYKLYFYYLQLYCKCHKKERGFLKKLLYYSNNILRISQGDNYDVMFLDEGIIQFLSSLFYMEDIPQNSDIKKIVHYLNNKIVMRPILCSVDMNVSLKRIKERPYKQTGRFSHSIGASVLEKALKHKAYNLDVISSYFPSHIEIDMIRPVIYNTDFLLSKIKHNLNLSDR